MNYKFNFQDLLPYWPEFLSGAWVTLQLTVAAVLFGIVIGILCAIARRSHVVVIRAIAGAYVELIRNTPFIVQIFFLFFGLASTGLRMPIMVAAVFALVINVGAYTAEIIRAGMDAVPKGQIEAAESLGLSGFQIYRDIIILPAIEKVYPALTSQFILMMLTTSICSQISAEELTGVANNIQSNTFRSFETYIVIGLFYIGITFLMRGAFWAIGQVAFPRRRIMGDA